MSILAAENDDPMPFLKPQFMLSQGNIWGSKVIFA